MAGGRSPGRRRLALQHAGDLPDHLGPAAFARDDRGKLGEALRLGHHHARPRGIRTQNNETYPLRCVLNEKIAVRVMGQKFAIYGCCPHPSAADTNRGCQTREICVKLAFVEMCGRPR
jgi:hypothetical protein